MFRRMLIMCKEYKIKFSWYLGCCIRKPIEGDELENFSAIGTWMREVCGWINTTGFRGSVSI